MPNKKLLVSFDIDTMAFLQSTRPGWNQTAIIREALRNMALQDAKQAPPVVGVTSVPKELPASVAFADALADFAAS